MYDMDTRVMAREDTVRSVESPVTVALDELGSTMAQLEEMLRVLDQRLRPVSVSKPQPGAPEDPQPLRSDRSELAEALVSRRVHAQSMITHVRIMLDQLEV